MYLKKSFQERERGKSSRTVEFNFSNISIGNKSYGMTVLFISILQPTDSDI